ncbi:hypothetical protein BAS09_16745 [Elizabethkingia ursingii]|uniref:glycosyltransferase n=1 Tax=Elizabethkingia ursingii TaxID=1756150 RepID=UPI00099B0E96|nr:glycosyltransferase [Elizabethkingia ursingii]OPC00332.1 hypothetical protein BAS09_16745 [Elizabethkingia ursingii]
MNSILSIIVTYNPNLEEFHRNIESIANQSSLCVVVDNNSHNQKDIEKIVENTYNSIIIKNLENIGLGKAYNMALNKYLGDYSFFATFDQDSFISEKTLDTLSQILEKNHIIGVVGPLFSYECSVVLNTGNLIYKDSIIQSSAVFRSDLYYKIGGFKEDYFIDSVDFEYCLRIAANNYKVAIFDGIRIQHSLGEQRKKLGISYYSHSALRNFYIARNHMKISKEYYQRFPKFVFKKNIFFLIHFLKLVFLEQDLKKINSFFKGLKQGL